MWLSAWTDRSGAPRPRRGGKGESLVGQYLPATLVTVSQREVILDATWNGVAAVEGHALAELVEASGMSHEESLAWTRRHVRKVRETDVWPWPDGT